MGEKRHKEIGKKQTNDQTRIFLPADDQRRADALKTIENEGHRVVGQPYCDRDRWFVNIQVAAASSDQP